MPRRCGRRGGSALGAQEPGGDMPRRGDGNGSAGEVLAVARDDVLSAAFQRTHRLDRVFVVGQNQVQRGLNFSIVDEEDSILVDEARTPMNIRQPA